MAAMWSYISEKLLEAIPLEPDSEITGIMINSLCKVYQYIFYFTALISVIFSGSVLSCLV